MIHLFAGGFLVQTQNYAEQDAEQRGIVTRKPLARKGCKRHHPTKKGSAMTQVSLEEAQRRLGDDVVVALEPGEQWVFDPATGSSGRLDGRFYKTAPVQHPGGYEVVALIEEPNVDQPTDGSPRIVGQVVVQVNRYGLIRVRKAKGLNGEIVELMPSSLSKGELSEHGIFGEPFEANPQRLMGFIQPVVVAVDFPDEEGMTLWEFVSQSTDGRSLAALAKLRLLR